MSHIIYWAAPLFTQAERIWNRVCVEALRDRGYAVVCPQDEAASFLDGEVVDYAGVAEHCYHHATHCDIVVAVLDGADSDSGTSVEVGLAIAHRRLTGGRPRVIGVRTDFRASEDDGLNAMFRLVDDVVRFSSLSEDAEALCEAIHQKVLVIDADAVRGLHGGP